METEGRLMEEETGGNTGDVMVKKIYAKINFESGTIVIECMLVSLSLLNVMCTFLQCKIEKLFAKFCWKVL